MDKIELYGRTYCKNLAATVETLFTGPRTANGTFRIERAGIVFSDLQGNARAFIRRDGLGPVSIGHHDGKRFYMHSTAGSENAWLGVPDSYSATITGAQDLARLAYPQHAGA
jgi:hypothetical protein